MLKRDELLSLDEMTVMEDWVGNVVQAGYLEEIQIVLHIARA